MNEMQKSIHELEHHMDPMVVSQTIIPQSALPSNTEKNPKEQLHAVSLRNNRHLEKVPPKNKKVNAEQIPTKRTETKQKSAENVTEQPEVVACKPPPLFPQRPQKQKVDLACKKFLEILKQVHVNIPLVELLQELPKYAKYIKDVVANKRRLTEFETVTLTEEYCSRVRSKIPPKLKDSDSFTTSITIGNVEFRRALCDLGASINLMPTSMLKTLGLGEPRPTTVTLQLANKSLVYLDGIIEDVLMKVETFILPFHFIILDYKADKQVPLILGRGFLATADAIIRVREGRISMKVDGQEATFDVFKATELPTHYEELKMITIMEPELTSAGLDYFLSSKDTLERALVYNKELEGDAEVEECLFILDTSCPYVQGNKPFEDLKKPDTWKKPKPSIEDTPILEL
ncbi:uncharacterized protein LOC132607913 [Lycium barbarum]|uniref:uncharacterized protein LOC132607913 n=1 Tax=Lycium barbarum TaxID=112863 RepID=UPI00293E06D9|nr:uncharacterized protein LOC132607913 [Lycium barbarum]